MCLFCWPRMWKATTGFPCFTREKDGDPDKETEQRAWMVTMGSFVVRNEVHAGKAVPALLAATARHCSAA